MSWAWRQFLSLRLPLLLSSLRHARRHGSQQLSSVLASNKQISLRGYASKSIGDPHAKRHLYVVLDDHEDGFGIHKLDLGDDADLDGGVRHLPEPPVLRVALTTLGRRVPFAAVGSNIVAIGTTVFSPMLKDRWVPDFMGGVLIYNTKTSMLTVAPYLPSGLVGGYKAAMAVGNTLFMLGSEPPDFSDKSGGSLHCLTADLDPVNAEEDEFWDWEQLSGSTPRSPPWFWSSDRNPPRLPFLAEHITAHVAHTSLRRPTARPKILVSLRPTEASPLGATYSFSMTSGRWRRHGEWHMPVVGQVHYDGKLDAWVGLHAGNGGNMHGPLVTDGRLCVGNNTFARSEWKFGKQKLFRLDEDGAAGWRHVDAKLVPIASGEGRNEYCIMERLRLEGEEEKTKDGNPSTLRPQPGDFWGDGGMCLLRLTTFCVERGQDGEPIVTARGSRSYEVSWHLTPFEAQAFWM